MGGAVGADLVEPLVDQPRDSLLDLVADLAYDLERLWAGSGMSQSSTRVGT